jgi:hypothetical protein
MSFATILHSICNNPAFLYDHMPKPGETIHPEYVTTLNGQWVPDGVVGMRCGSCGARLQAKELAPGLMVYNMADEDDMEIIYGEYLDEQN